MGTPYFVSDIHLNHARICELSDRPFKDVDEMNRVIIDNWNQMVGPEDDVYLLGDVAMGQRHLMGPLVSRLMGRIHLIRGNHDKLLLKDPENHKLFASISDLLEIEIPDPKAEGGRQKIAMCHYAIESFHDQHRGAWMLHGHSHGTLRSPTTMRRLDVGVDATAWRLGRVASSYRPLSYEEIREYMSHRTFEPVDNHGK